MRPEIGGILDTPFHDSGASGLTTNRGWRALWLATSCTIAALALTADARASARGCGSVPAIGTSFHVYVLDGRVGCRAARKVVAYVLTHGRPSQGSPGSSPRGWSCAWGFGYFHGERFRSGRAGPLCTHGRLIVQGLEAGYTIAAH